MLEEKEKIVERSSQTLQTLVDEYDAYAKKLKERIEGGHEIEDKDNDDEDKKSQSPENKKRGKRHDNSDSDDDQ